MITKEQKLTENNMELQEFFEKYLPDYEGKLRKIEEFYQKFYPELIVDMTSFYYRHFPEALQNYTNLICEKQRENCADNYNDYEFDEFIYNNILRASQPKIEELFNNQ